jgi:hypothetical protein
MASPLVAAGMGAGGRRSGVVVRLVVPVLILLTAACTLPPPDPEVVARECEQRAREAQGPTGSLTIGLNSRSGPSVEGAIGVNSNFLRGRDPMEVYSSCVYQRTGQGPIRPPVLR